MTEVKRSSPPPAGSAESKAQLKAPAPRAPRFEILELTDELIRFELLDTDLSMANALRRVMIAEVPTMAIEHVEVYENTSLIHDQMLTARLGLVPLDSTTVDQYLDFRDCKCPSGECGYCAAELRLDVKNNTEDIMFVTTDHLVAATEVRPAVLPASRPLVFADEEVVQSDSKGDTKQQAKSAPRGEKDLEFTGKQGVVPSVVLAKLGPRQEIIVRALARKGIGKDHAKWNPTAVATFQQPASVHVDPTVLTEDQQKKVVAVCPTGVFAMDGKQQLRVADALKCMYCNDCVDLVAKWDRREAIVVEEQPERFIFTVESTGALPPAQIVMSAMAELRARVEAVQRESPAVSSRSA